MEKRMMKKGQVTIFILIAVIIIAVGILIYLFYPKITSIGFDSKNPSAYMQSCLEKEIEKSADLLSPKGGSINPEHYFMYQGDTIEYLCYTEEYYKTCVMQQPLLKNHVEEEIKKNIQADVDKCFDALKQTYESKGYNVNLKSGETKVELLPKRITTSFTHTLSVTKDSTENYGGEDEKQIRVVVNNNLYELTSIASSILNMEARYGDAETTIYMNYYRDLKVEKKLQTDGTTIYILTDRNNQNKFQFASRSVAWPPGYGLNE